MSMNFKRAEIVSSESDIIVKSAMYLITEPNNKFRIVVVDDAGNKRYLSSSGLDGKSAYEVAVQNGYTGTVTEWLNSLEGQQGPKGEQGIQGQQGPKGDTGYKTIDPVIINPNDPAPTTVQFYKPSLSSDNGLPYPNLIPAVDENGNSTTLTAKNGFDTLFFYNGTNWIKTENKLPQATQYITPFESSTFPIIGPAQRTYNNGIWELEAGISVNSMETPGNSNKWKIIGAITTATTGKNLFNKDTMVFNGLVQFGGSILSINTYKYAVIDVEPLTTYKVSKAPSGGIVWYNFKDSAGNLLLNASFNETIESMNGIIESPSGAAKWEINVVNMNSGSENEGVGDLNTFQIEKGTITTTYEPYTLYLASVNGLRVPKSNQIPNENYIDLNVVVGGDSITAATGAIGWVDQLLKNMSFKSFNRYARSGATWTNFSGTTDSALDNSGVNNTISNQIQKLFYDYDNATIQKPDVIIILAGVNDARDMPLGTIEGAFPAYDSPILQLTPGQVNTLTEAIRWNIERVLQKFPDIQVIITTPLQSGNDNLPRVKQTRDLIKECALRLGVQVIDQYADSGIYGFNEIGNNHKYLSDNLHPNAAGAKKVALFLMQQFKKKIIKSYPL